MGVGREYLGVVLQLRRLVPAWVESYTGPAELGAAVEAGDAPSIEGVRERAGALADRVSYRTITSNGLTSCWSARYRAKVRSGCGIAHGAPTS